MSPKSSSNPASSVPAANVPSNPPPNLPTSPSSPEAQSPTTTPDVSTPPSTSSPSGPDETICPHCEHLLSAHQGPDRRNQCNGRRYCRNCEDCSKGKKKPRNGRNGRNGKGKAKSTCRPLSESKGPQPPRGPDGAGLTWDKVAVDDRRMVKLRPQTGGQGRIRAPVGHLWLYGEVYVISVPLAIWIKALLTELERSVVFVMGLGSEFSCAGRFCGDAHLGSALAVC